MPAGLTVDDLAISCRIGSAGRGQPQRAQEILDRVIGAVTNELPGLVARVLATEPDTDEIIYVPAVHFDATVNASWSPDRIARALVAPLMRSVWRSVTDPAAVRFRDRAELVARFILDVAQGQAYTRDWHEEFVGLKLLPASALLRTLIEGQPEDARKALARLTHDQLRQCVGLLRGSDARRVLTQMLCERSSDELTLRALVDALISQSFGSLEEPQHQLIFAIATFREMGHVLDSNSLALAQAALRVAGEARLAEFTEVECRDLLFSRMLTLMRAHGSGAQMHAGLDAAFLGEDSALDILGSLRAAIGTGSHAENRSAHAGPWLLLPSLLEYVSAHEVGSSLATIVLAAAAFAAGSEARDVWRDSELRKALDLNDELIAESLANAATNFPLKHSARLRPVGPWLRERPRATLRRDRAHLASAEAVLPLPHAFRRLANKAAWRALLGYAQRLPGFAGSSFSHLWTNFLRTPAHVRTDERELEVLLDRPPLHIIWRISGADRATYTIPRGWDARVCMREATR